MVGYGVGLFPRYTRDLLVRELKKSSRKLTVSSRGKAYSPPGRLASFTGQIISRGPVAGNVTRIMTRHCCLTIACAEHWDSAIELDTYCLDELLFWKNNLNSLKARFCFLLKKPHCFAFSDASATGCGAKITLDKTYVSHKLWKDEEREKSSTWRELAAISFSLESFSKLLECSHVKMVYGQSSSSQNCRGREYETRLAYSSYPNI